jgi:2-keto-4-pentenoate hydratase/2-oxohepta-3-ene-1,7-dioic acid hydratase in catechol pathway
MRSITLRPSNRKIPIGKLLCLGRNYADHAREMNSPVPDSPIVFLKPSSAVIADGDAIVIPPFSHDVHHEVEMVVLIGKEGKHIARAEAMNHVAGFGVGLDITLRDVQAVAKKGGLPWSVAKGFDTSAPISTMLEAGSVGNPHELDISLKVNGEIRQQSNTRNMIFSVDHVVSYLSTIFTLDSGDIIYMGTPEGVGPLKPGDTLEAELHGVSTLTVSVRAGS